MRLMDISKQPVALGLVPAHLWSNSVKIAGEAHSGRSASGRMLHGVAARFVPSSRTPARVAVIGMSSTLQATLDALALQTAPRVAVVGALALDADGTAVTAAAGQTAADNAPQVLTDLGDVLAKIRDGQIDRVLLALPGESGEQVARLVEHLRGTPVAIWVIADAAKPAFPNAPATRIGDLTALRVRECPLAPGALLTKRIEDVVIASALLLALAPLMLLIAALIKLDSKGPVLFRQRRYGLNNGLISVFKFRSMHVAMQDANCDQQTTRGDKRVTRVGRWLRRSSLDELPQLFNVLLGTMSMVGPRPHAIGTKAQGQVFEDAVPNYMARHQVKPGITGWAQVNGWRGETDTLHKIERRVDFDLHYIHNWSLLFDLKIIARTVTSVFGHSNAY